MIWDLDDSIEVDVFDAEIYSKLQTLLRTAALKIADIVVRMKLEPPRTETTISPASDRPRTPSIILSPSPSSPMEAKAGPIQDWEGGEKQREEQPIILLEDMPHEPPEDPWKGTAAQSLTLKIDSLSTEDAIIQRRPRISIGGQSHESDDLVSPLTPDHDASSPPFNQSPASASRDHIVSPLDEDPRNSFILSPDNPSLIPLGTNHREPFPKLEQTLHLSQPEPNVSASPISYECGLSPIETTALRPAYTIPDTEGLIPVDYDDGITPSTQSHQSPHHLPTVISIDAFPGIGINTARFPPDYNHHRHHHRQQSTSPSPISSNETSPETLPLLHFPPATKIISVSFPAQYAGEWAIGQIDNARGIFPMDCVRLEMPKGEGDTFKTGASPRKIAKSRTANANMSAVARWRHVPATTSSKKEREGSTGGGSFGFSGSGGDSLQWLRFEQGEVITGVYCELSLHPLFICLHLLLTFFSPYIYTLLTTHSVPHPQHWCWAGYNAKGKYGIFPRAFMTPGTLLEEAPSNLLQLLHKEVVNKRAGISSLLTSTPNSENAKPSGTGIAIPSVGNVFSRISSKGLGLRRLSGGNKDGGGGVNGNGNGYVDWSASAASDEAPPDSPSGSYYTPGSAGSSSTWSPRPSLY